MGKARATYIERARAREMWEQGDSYAHIGRELGFKDHTISTWAKKEGWTRTETAPATVGPFTNAATEAASFTPTPPEGENKGDFTFQATTGEAVAEREQSEQDLRDRLKILEAENTRLEAENEELSPTRDIQAMLDDRVQWLTDNSPEGERYWLNRAEAEYKKTNIERAQQGLPVFDIKQHPEILDDLINEIKTKAVADAAKETTSPPSRKVKLFIMRNGMPTIEQIPMENQINNMAGSLADGIVRYTRKGFKLTSPFLCPRAGCFRPAGVDEMSRWTHDGYCTDKHRTEVEGTTDSPMAGLHTRDTVLSGI